MKSYTTKEINDMKKIHEMKEKSDHKKRNKEQREMSNLRDSFSTDTPADAIVQIIMIVGAIAVAFIFCGSRYL